MAPHSGPLVLTVNPQDERKDQLSSLIRRSQAPVYISLVAGFGRPELRIGPGEYVHGLAAISSVIQENSATK